MSDEKRADAIKNCPCCGGKAMLFKKRSYFQFFIVGCTECGLRTDDMPAVEKAIERWNTRKPVDRTVEKTNDDDVLNGQMNMIDYQESQIGR